jgi:hypothetical protein
MEDGVAVKPALVDAEVGRPVEPSRTARGF